MRKKVGMLSFHESLSYGATLQCYALQTKIKELGYDAEFIDFRREKCTDYEIKDVKPSRKEKLITVVIDIVKWGQKIFTRKNDLVVRQLFQMFKNEHIRIGNREYCSIKDLYSEPPLYDVYVTGSDQVWNPYSKYLQAYGLGFIPEKALGVAYAASIGVSEIPDEKKAYLYKNICNVDVVSCREREGAVALERLLEHRVENVLDPTLLLSKNDWSNVTNIEEKKDRYVLCFFLGSLEYPRKVAREIAKKNDCKLYVIPGSPKDLISAGKSIKRCGPREFLNWFRNADFICTDSFHGTAFAINLNKPFYSFCRRGYNEMTSYLSRIRDLLVLVGLEERLIYPESRINYSICPIDYNDVNIRLDEEREKSVLFLADALSGKGK